MINLHVQAVLFFFKIKLEAFDLPNECITNQLKMIPKIFFKLINTFRCL